MERLNDAPILEQTEGMRDRILMAALWKLNGGQVVKVTAQDLERYIAAFKGEPILFMHGHVDSIEVGIVTLERAKELAAHQAAMTSSTRQ
jgi:hypothetical protein